MSHKTKFQKGDIVFSERDGLRGRIASVDDSASDFAYGEQGYKVYFYGRNGHYHRYDFDLKLIKGE